ncbi:MAG: GGDEF domain-containing protein [Acidobacteriaceae bacterium]
MKFQLTRRVFTDLLISMAVFGLAIGLAFPFFASLMGVPRGIAFSDRFVFSCIGAGLIVAVVNFVIVSSIVRPRMRDLSGKMHQVGVLLQQFTYTGDWSQCSPETCYLDEDSLDELGDVTRAFNALLRALMRAHSIEQAIGTFTQTLSSKLDLDELSVRALSLLQENTGAQAGALLIEREGRLVVAASSGLTATESLTHSDVLHQAMRKTQMQRISLQGALSMDGVLTQFIPSEVLVVPVPYQNAAIGVVVLCSSAPFAPDTERLLPLLKQGLGLALNNALTHADLLRIAALDSLTGAYNRRFGMTRLSEEMSRAARSKVSLGLVMFDIDHFKRVNDAYGHLGL